MPPTKLGGRTQTRVTAVLYVPSLEPASPCPKRVPGEKDHGGWAPAWVWFTP